MRRPPAGARLQPRGSNQVGMRQFNERVVLQAIRLHGRAARGRDRAADAPDGADRLADHQAAARGDDLLRKREPLRGKVGQPSVPMALNPDGAFCDRHQDRPAQPGHAAGRLQRPGARAPVAGLPLPRPRHAVRRDRRAPEGTASRRLGRAAAQRLQGIGIAAPLSLGGWQALLGVEPELAAKWQRIDIRERVAAMTELPVELVKDTAAACVAELVAGRGREHAQLPLRLRRHLHRRRPGASTATCTPA